MRDEVETKLERLAACMAARQVDAVHLRRADDVAWLTGGARVYVDASSEEGIASVLITPRGRFVITNNIEAPRLQVEEPLEGFTFVAPEWHDEREVTAELAPGLRLGVDVPTAGAVDLRSELVALRAPLVPAEVSRYRALGRDVGAAMMHVARSISPGQREHEVAGHVADAVLAVGAYPVVVLVAADARLERYRHPLPTDARVERVVMWVVCARRQGLIANLTRIVSFGRPSDELRRRMRAVAEVEATAHVATRPGAPVREVLARMIESYARVGFADAWRAHHQGGACSYGSRDYVVTPRSTERVHASQAFAWNPSVPGAKSEDTVLVSHEGLEVLTHTPGWPMIELDVDGRMFVRPDVLVR